MAITTNMTIPYVRWAGLDFAPPRHTASSRRLYDHEINYVLSGHGTFIVEGKEYSAGPDSCFFVQPRVPHESCNSHDVPWVTLGVHFDWQTTPDCAESFPTFRADDSQTPTDETLFRLAQDICGWDHRARPVLDLTARSSVRHFLEELVDAFAHNDEFSRGQAGGLLLAALCQIQREAHVLTHQQSAHIGPDAQRRLARAHEMLQDVSPESPSVAQVAERVGWSADHLTSMARIAWGISPRRLHSLARLRRARELLQQNVPIHEVARQCGFADASHLARAFRRDSGLSPREYSALSLSK